MERRELPQRGPGQSPGRKRILGYFESHRTLLFVSIGQQEAQLSQRDRAAACLNYGKNISAKSVHLGYFFKSPVATVSSTHYLGSLIMSMPASVT